MYLAANSEPLTTPGLRPEALSGATSSPNGFIDPKGDPQLTTALHALLAAAPAHHFNLYGNVLYVTVSAKVPEDLVGWEAETPEAWQAFLAAHLGKDHPAVPAVAWLEEQGEEGFLLAMRCRDLPPDEVALALGAAFPALDFFIGERPEVRGLSATF